MNKLKLVAIALGLLLITNNVIAADKIDSKSAKNKLLEHVVEPETIEQINKKLEDIKKLEAIFGDIQGVDPTKPIKSSSKLEDNAINNTENVGEEGSEKEQPLSVTAIFVSGKNRHAVINGKVVREGDKISDRTVQRIYKDKVIIEDFDTVKEFSFPTNKIRVNTK